MCGAIREAQSRFRLIAALGFQIGIAGTGVIEVIEARCAEGMPHARVGRQFGGERVAAGNGTGIAAAELVFLIAPHGKFEMRGADSFEIAGKDRSGVTFLRLIGRIGGKFFATPFDAGTHVPGGRFEFIEPVRLVLFGLEVAGIIAGEDTVVRRLPDDQSRFPCRCEIVFRRKLITG